MVVKRLRESGPPKSPGPSFRSLGIFWANLAQKITRPETNIATGNPPFEDVYSIKTGGFPASHVSLLEGSDFSWLGFGAFSPQLAPTFRTPPTQNPSRQGSADPPACGDGEETFLGLQGNLSGKKKPKCHPIVPKKSPALSRD